MCEKVPYDCRGCGIDLRKHEDGGFEHEANCLALKLDAETKERESWQVLANATRQRLDAMEDRVDEQRAIIKAGQGLYAEHKALESRLHQLSEDHSHCEDLLHELGARASSAESRLDAIRKLVTEPQPHVAGWETLEEIEKLVVETHAKGCTRTRPHSGPCDDGIGELVPQRIPVYDEMDAEQQGKVEILNRLQHVVERPALKKLEHGPYDEVYEKGLKWLDENG
jgi:hypothetical protein